MEFHLLTWRAPSVETGSGSGPQPGHGLRPCDQRTCTGLPGQCGLTLCCKHAAGVSTKLDSPTACAVASRSQARSLRFWWV